MNDLQVILRIASAFKKPSDTLQLVVSATHAIWYIRQEPRLDIQGSFHILHELNYTRAMLIDPYQFQSVRVENVVREASDAVSVRLTLPKHYDFTPGQHAVVRVPMPDGSHLIRQYSFAAPVSTGELWLTVVREPGGQVSGWFVDTAKTGDAVEISHPFTGPLVHKNPYGEICIIAGGSGIAPLMAFVRELRSKQKSFTLLYSTRTNEFCFERELSPLAGEDITVRLTDVSPRLTQEDISSRISKDMSVFICGSRSFVLTMRDYCKDSIPPEQLHSEAFTLE